MTCFPALDATFSNLVPFPARAMRMHGERQPALLADSWRNSFREGEWDEVEVEMYRQERWSSYRTAH